MDCSSFVSHHFVKNCGYDTEGTSSIIIITTPHSNSNSRHVYNCVWNINAPPSSSISLQLTDFSFGSPNDKLFILQPSTCLPFVSHGNATLYSSESPPPPGPSIHLFQATVAIYLYAETSNMALGGGGSSIAWSSSQTTADCSPVVSRLMTSSSWPAAGGFVKNCGSNPEPLEAIGSSGTVHYPPAKVYSRDPQNVFCTWSLRGPPGSYIQLNFDNLHMDQRKDQLFIMRPRSCSLVTQLSGSSSSSLLVREHEVVLYFVLLDGLLTSTSSSGFVLNWTAVLPPLPGLTLHDGAHSETLKLAVAETPKGCDGVVNSAINGGGMLVKNCGHDVRGEDSSISSLGPHSNKNNSSNSKFCVWHVVAPPGTTVSLSVLFFNLNETAGDKLFILHQGCPAKFRF